MTIVWSKILALSSIRSEDCRGPEKSARKVCERETFGAWRYVKVRQIVEIGVPYKRIVEKAEEEGVDMIIMSTHGRSGFDHMLIGGVTEKVVRRASCPVLSIRPPLHTKAT